MKIEVHRITLDQTGNTVLYVDHAPTFFFFSFSPPIPFIIFARLFSISLLTAVAQIRDHTEGSPPPPYGCAWLFLSREAKFSPSFLRRWCRFFLIESPERTQKTIVACCCGNSCRFDAARTDAQHSVWKQHHPAKHRTAPFQAAWTLIREIGSRTALIRLLVLVSPTYSFASVRFVSPPQIFTGLLSFRVRLIRPLPKATRACRKTYPTGRRSSPSCTRWRI